MIDLIGLEIGGAVAFTKGAVDGLLDIATHYWDEGIVKPLTAEKRQDIERSNDQLAQDGLRVLGLAYRVFDHPAVEMNGDEAVESDLIFVGMVGIIDPPRTEVRNAVSVCRTAGIRPIMITGDHPLTAFAIARELGIAKDGDRILTGKDLARLSVEELREEVERVAVFARVSPEHKLNIVQALQDRGISPL